MERIIHYTTDTKWKEIEKRGALLPLSPANEDPDCELSDRVKSVIKHPLYLVGIPENQDNGWISCGMMEMLLEYTSDQVVSSVPILQRDGAFLREHFHLSPQRFTEIFGFNFWKAIGEGKLDLIDDPRMMEAYNLYNESTVSLLEYNGGYKAEEIWLPQTTPVEKLTRVK